jgi:hypothetical protein
LILLALFSRRSCDDTSSTQEVETGNRVVSRSYHRLLIGLPLNSGECGIFQTPPDLVVKFQSVDNVDFILWLVWRQRVVYQREIKG